MITIRRNIQTKLATIAIAFLILLGIIGPIFINENGLIPYDASTIDLKSMNHPSPSIENLHLFGTDTVGRDVLAGCVYGIQNAFSFGLLATIIALIIGLSLGVLSGFYYKNGLKLNTAAFVSLKVGGVIFMLLWIISSPTEIELASNLDLFLAPVIAMVLSITISISLYFVLKLFLKQSTFNLNIDLWIGRYMEGLESLPALFILITAMAFLDANFIVTSIIVGCLMWISIARICRAEIMKIKQQNFIESAIAIGLKDHQIIRKHILPNISQPIIIQLIFTFSNCILIESTLNFIGIGTTITEISWGSMLAEAGQNLDAWWLLVFPALFVFITIYSFRILATQLGKITPDTPL